ncbi:phosphoenolpyruvate--protein phosphotransferase [Virgisporangium aurantiacum]|uniref:Phosphoenolpyruvate-protein phosphotransferase n=1 Tax=Virgisporangium aurantiacum TaxID=175570 RepID=A0A8J3ZDX4_9ACTN|nr:phosphoenolpyruvate--protein phosphotransferase [Virgisporangium aurantiacum]GIJ59841.1 phosphoenolpyruvate-protein phosphotransferase [Virgisporangium aurantiacum]
MAELKGIGVSPGGAGAPAYKVAPPPRLPTTQPAALDPDVEAKRAIAALASVTEELSRRADAATGPAAEILRAEAMMAEDPELADAAAQAARDGMSAAHAIDAALAVHRAAFEEAGGYLAERVADLDDIRNRAVAICLGLPMPGIPSPGQPFVLIARDLAPADTAQLDPAEVVALVTEDGGPTSHTAILARTLGIPAVVRCTGVLGVEDGTVVIVDGTGGVVRLAPTAAEVEAAREAEAARQERLRSTSGPGSTADGHQVALYANIGGAKDLLGDVEGVGLFRTELLYLDRTDAPSFDDQVAAYTEVFAALPGRKVVVRTLDAGADKPLPFLSQSDEPNPALGVRGLRISWRRPDVLETQLKAIAAAAKAASAEVWVMAPMVATPQEAATFVAACRAAGLPTAGAMVEIPAAALRAGALLAEVDFLSIGTNDLSQYTFASDRQVGELAELLDPWQPALLELIAMCASAGKAAGKPVGVCGEAAADPALAVVLTGLGITSLSMAARSIPAVREALAARTLEECQRLAHAALTAETAEAARAAAR